MASAFLNAALELVPDLRNDSVLVRNRDRRANTLLRPSALGFTIGSPTACRGRQHLTPPYHMLPSNVFFKFMPIWRNHERHDRSQNGHFSRTLQGLSSRWGAIAPSRPCRNSSDLQGARLLDGHYAERPFLTTLDSTSWRSISSIVSRSAWTAARVRHTRLCAGRTPGSPMIANVRESVRRNLQTRFTRRPPCSSCAEPTCRPCKRSFATPTLVDD
jgi:hypothetical protein